MQISRILIAHALILQTADTFAHGPVQINDNHMIMQKFVFYVIIFYETATYGTACRNIKYY